MSSLSFVLQKFSSEGCLVCTLPDCGLCCFRKFCSITFFPMYQLFSFFGSISEFSGMFDLLVFVCFMYSFVVCNKHVKFTRKVQKTPQIFIFYHICFIFLLLLLLLSEPFESMLYAQRLFTAKYFTVYFLNLK